MIVPAPHHSPRRSRRASRLMIACFAFILVAMWGSIAYYIIQSRTARIEEEQRVLLRMAHVVHEQARSLFSFLDYFLVSADAYFQEHPLADPRSDPVFLAQVKEFKARTNGMIDIRFVSSRGRLYYLGTSPDAPLADVTDRDYFLAHTRPDAPPGLFIGKPVLSRVTGRWGLPISYPLAARPQGISVIFAAIENRILSNTLEDGRTKPDGTILIAHHDGTVLFRSPDIDLIGKSLAETPIWKETVLHEKEGGFQIARSPVDGRARIGAFTSAPEYPLVVLATSTLDDSLAGWRQRSLGLSLFGMVATLIGIGMLVQLARFTRDLESTRQKLEQQALTDELTQIANRRHFLEQGELELMRAARYHHPLSLLMLDIDHFKNVNDTQGHAGGDRVLKALARTIQAESRVTDLPGRLGGEEFAVLLPDTDQPMAVTVAERFRLAIAAMSVTDAGAAPISVTASIGVATLGSHDQGFNQLLARADKALYQAKDLGRNRVCCDSQTP